MNFAHDETCPAWCASIHAPSEEELDDNDMEEEGMLHIKHEDLRVCKHGFGIHAPHLNELGWCMCFCTACHRDDKCICPYCKDCNDERVKSDAL